MGVDSADIPLCEVVWCVLAAARRALTSVGGGRRTRPPIGASGPPEKPPFACELDGVTGLAGRPCPRSGVGRFNVVGEPDAPVCVRRCDEADEPCELVCEACQGVGGVGRP